MHNSLTSRSRSTRTGRHLSNYMRAYRKLAGLSQHEVAFLLGCRTASKASRYERFLRNPSLATVFGYEAIFDVPARHLAAGIFQAVQAGIRERALVLIAHLETAKQTQITARKLNLLHTIIAQS